MALVGSPSARLVFACSARWRAGGPEEAMFTPS